MTQPSGATADALTRAIGDEFTLVRELGKGGMGVVFLARDLQLQRDIAVKTLPPHLAADPAVRARFLREARTAAALSHAHIVPIYSAAERDEVVFFTMAYVDGESLAERVARAGPLPPDAVIRLLDELASALGAAHARGVVHRDVKAENVLLDRRTGHAMVTDFGIARVSETPPLTATGTVLGTVHYMSPEQVNGATLDGRSDLYSLGVLAFFALTGRFPFERPTPSAVVVAHVNATPPSVATFAPHCPPDLERVVARLLAKVPDDRYRDAEALRDAVRTVQRDVESLRSPATLSSITPVVLSSREAQEVWSRAAELQANTGMITPPAQFSAHNDTASVTQGYDAALIKASALEAGIDERYVERALVERSRREPVAIETTTGNVTIPARVAGAALTVEVRATLEGALRAADFEALGLELRRALGQTVAVTVVGNTLTVNTSRAGMQPGASSRVVHVHVASRNGRTELRLYEDLSQCALTMHVGAAIGAGLGLGSIVAAWVAKGTETSGATGVAVLLLSMVMSHIGARLLFANTFARRRRALEEMAGRLVDTLRHPKDDRSSL